MAFLRRRAPPSPPAPTPVVQTTIRSLDELKDLGARNQLKFVEEIEIHHAGGDEALRQICELSEECPKLSRLRLSNNRMTTCGSLAASIAVGAPLTILYLSGNMLGDVSSLLEALMLSSRNSIRVVALHDNRIGNDQSGAIATFIASCPNLEQLSLHDNQLAGRARQELARVVASHPVLYWFSFDSGTNQCAHFKRIADALPIVGSRTKAAPRIIDDDTEATVPTALVAPQVASVSHNAASTLTMEPVNQESQSEAASAVIARAPQALPALEIELTWEELGLANVTSATVLA